MKQNENLTTCNQCNKVYFKISRKKAKDEVTMANKFYIKCTPELKSKFFKKGPAKLSQYESCLCGNNYKNFRDFKEGDCEVGEMLTGIIDRKQ